MASPRKNGQTSNVERITIVDSTTGAMKTGLTSASSGLIIGTIAHNESTSTAYTTTNLETITTLGTYAAPTSGKARFKEVDATNHPGLYEYHLADARYAVASAKELIVSIVCTGCITVQDKIPLSSFDPYDAVRGGLTALPNAAAEAAGGLFTRGTGAGQINQDANGRIDANVKTWISGAIPAVNVTGVPIVDDKYLLGTIYSTPATAGIQDVNMKNIANAAVSTSSAQIGVNAVNIGGTAQTGRDLGASVLISTGTGSGQLDVTSGRIKADTVYWNASAVSVPTNAGVPNVNVKTWNDLATVALPLVPTTAGRTLDVSSTGEAGIDWANVGSPTTTVAFTGTTIASTQKVDIETIKTNPVVNAGTITFPTTATLASTTNITAGTVTTATNLTNAPTSGDFTATMKTSLNNATPAVTVSDKTGFSLSSAGVQAIWDALTSALTTVGSIGKLLVTNIDAAISSRSSYTGGDTAGTTTLLARLTATRAGNLDSLDAAVSTRLATSGYTAPLDAAGTRSAVGLASANLDTQLGTLATPAQVNAEVVDALSVDTYGQPSQGSPAATTSMKNMLAFLYKAWRNKTTQTADTYSLYNDDESTVDHKSTTSDDAVTFTKTEITSGP